LLRITRRSVASQIENQLCDTGLVVNRRGGLRAVGRFAVRSHERHKRRDADREVPLHGHPHIFNSMRRLEPG
jgi:hypothetical protein